VFGWCLAHRHTLTQEHNNQGEAFAYSVEALSHSAPEDHPHGFEPIAERLDRRMKLELSVTDGTIFVNLAGATLSGTLQRYSVREP
jgi:hypothetical protein